MTDEALDVIWRKMFRGDCFCDAEIKKAIKEAYALGFKAGAAEAEAKAVRECYELSLWSDMVPANRIKAEYPQHFTESPASSSAPTA